jgi:hypothetical protein
MTLMAKTVVEIFDRYASRYDSWYERNKIIAENEVKLVKTISTGVKTPA